MMRGDLLGVPGVAWVARDRAWVMRVDAQAPGDGVLRRFVDALVAPERSLTVIGGPWGPRDACVGNV